MSARIVLAYIVLSLQHTNCRPFGIGLGGDVSNITMDQIADFARVEDLDNERCVTGPLCHGSRSSYSTTSVGPKS